MDDFLTKPVRPAELFAAIDQLVRAPGGSHGVSQAGQQDTRERRRLLDPDALLTACGDDAEWLRGMCQVFQTYVPARLAEVAEALRDQDANRGAADCSRASRGAVALDRPSLQRWVDGRRLCCSAFGIPLKDYSPIEFANA